MLILFSALSCSDDYIDPKIPQTGEIKVIYITIIPMQCYLCMYGIWTGTDHCHREQHSTDTGKLIISDAKMKDSPNLYICRQYRHPNGKGQKQDTGTRKHRKGNSLNMIPVWEQQQERQSRKSRKKTNLDIKQ